MLNIVGWCRSKLSLKARVLFLTLLGTYLNAAAYGFRYPLGGDYDFQLPLLNWLRNPALYPGDPIRDAYARFPTVFWPVVAALSNWLGTEQVLFGFFVLTKLVFFLALSWLVAVAVREQVLATCVVAALSLSPLLSASMPFGAGRVLVDVQTHASLGTAMLFLAGVLLVLGRWYTAVVVAALSVYIDALPFLHTVPAFALFAFLDWRWQKRRVCIAGALGIAICLPWLLLSRHALAASFPSNYLQGLLLFFPFHSTVRWTPAATLLNGVAILVAAGWMSCVARENGITRLDRLERLVASYFVVVLTGVVLGLIGLTPQVARLCLPRADAFLIPYAIVLVQGYGANLICQDFARYPVRDFLLEVSSILLPLSIHLMVPALFVLFIFRLVPRQQGEGLLYRAGGPGWHRHLTVQPWPAVVCGTALVLAATHIIPSVDSLRHFVRRPTPEQQGCQEVQQWARINTPLSAKFLVPPLCGFRSLSERSSWGEWKDGTAAFHYPPFADVFLQRESELGITPGNRWPDPGFMQENYKHQSWDHLQAIAVQNHLSYVVQFREIPYPAEPVFTNRWYAVYPITPNLDISMGNSSGR